MIKRNKCAIVSVLCVIYLASSNVVCSSAVNQPSGNSGSSSSTAAPVVSKMWSINPSTGPRAGGTSVTLTYTGDDSLLLCPNSSAVRIMFGSDELNANISRSKKVNEISFVTKRSNNTGDRSVNVVCGNLNITTNVTFTYQSDPSVLNIKPQATILVGGITQTITGSNLLPERSFNLTLSANNQQVTSTCSSCTYHPANTSQSCIKCKTGSMLFLFTSNNTQISDLKKDRDTVSTINATLSLDGWKTVFSMPVYLNPGVQQLSPETQNFIVNQNRQLSVTVLWPPFNLTSDDIMTDLKFPKKTIACNGVVVTSTGLSCTPANVDKQTVRYGLPEEKTPAVQITIGNSITIAGHLIYTLDESFNIVMIVMIALIAFIIVLSTVFGCLTLLHAQIDACCGGGSDDTKGLNGSSGGPQYENFDNEESGGKSAGRRRGKTGHYEMTGDEGDFGGGRKYSPTRGGDIEMVGQVARAEL